nr:alpha/beta hydrolase [Granulicella sp. L60]
MTSDGILNHFAQGLPMEERRIVLAVQGESYGPMFGEKLTVAAWKTRPSWVIIAANDQMLQPAMEEASAKRLGATAITLQTCHLAMLEQPAKVAAVIDQAAKTALRK